MGQLSIARRLCVLSVYILGFAPQLRAISLPGKMRRSSENGPTVAVDTRNALGYAMVSRNEKNVVPSSERTAAYGLLTGGDGWLYRQLGSMRPIKGTDSETNDMQPGIWGKKSVSDGNRAEDGIETAGPGIWGKRGQIEPGISRAVLQALYENQIKRMQYLAILDSWKQMKNSNKKKANKRS